MMFALNAKEQRRQRKRALGPPCIVCSQEEEAAVAEIFEPLLSAYLEAQLRLPVTWYPYKELTAGLWSIFLAVIYSEVTHTAPVETGNRFYYGLYRFVNATLCLKIKVGSSSTGGFYNCPKSHC